MKNYKSPRTVALLSRLERSAEEAKLQCNTNSRLIRENVKMIDAENKYRKIIK